MRNTLLSGCFVQCFLKNAKRGERYVCRLSVSVPVGSGHNYILLGNHHLTIRAYLAAYPGLSDKWRFYHQNGVDSTFADGEIAYRNRSGGSWTIVRARIGIGQCSSGVEMDTPDPVTGWVDVTYDGKTSREGLAGRVLLVG